MRNRGLCLWVVGLTLLGWQTVGFLYSCAPAWGMEPFFTQRTTICCESPADLAEFAHKLNFTPPAHFTRTYFSQTGPAPTASLGNLAAKIDGLIAEVSRLLRLWPPNPPRLWIYLVKDGSQVRQRYLLFQPIQGKPLLGYGPLEAFYEAGSRTAFVSLADVHEGILAHEMAHFLLCTAHKVPPPAHIQEDWARYIEARLK